MEVRSWRWEYTPCAKMEIRKEKKKSKKAEQEKLVCREKNVRLLSVTLVVYVSITWSVKEVNGTAGVRAGDGLILRQSLVLQQLCDVEHQTN